MYLVLRQKSFICFILVLFIIFASCAGVIMSSNVHAEVITATLSVKALWVAIAGISAGVVFTSPQGVNDFTEGVLHDLNNLPGINHGFSEQDYNDMLDQARKKFDEGKKRLPKPPQLPNLKNNMLITGALLGAGNLIDRVIAWLNGDDGSLNTSVSVGNTVFSVSTNKGNNFGQLQLRATSSLGVFHVGRDVGINDYKNPSIDNIVNNGDLVKVKQKDNSFYYYQPVIIHYSADNVGGSRVPFVATYNAFIGTVEIVVKPNVPKPKPMTLPDGVTRTNVEPDRDAQVFPMPFPTMPSPGVEPNEWEDFGFDTIEVPSPNPIPNPNPDPNPNPNPNPDPNPNPNPDKIKQPQEYPQIGHSQALDMDSGVHPSELVGLNQSSLNQWLQNNVYNITSNTYVTNNQPGIDINDPAFNPIGFDFRPLTDIGRALIRKFPFCIPFDLVDSIKLLAGKPVPPKFVLPLKVTNAMNRNTSTTEITIDFEQFETLAAISRISFTIIFLVALMFITSKTMKW